MKHLQLIRLALAVLLAIVGIRINPAFAAAHVSAFASAVANQTCCECTAAQTCQDPIDDERPTWTPR